MAFNKNDLKPISQSGQGTPDHWAYSSNDDIHTIRADGYFNEAFLYLDVRDVITVNSSSDSTPLTHTVVVTSVGNHSVIISRGSGLEPREPTNTVYVNSEDDFPDPIGFDIFLEQDTIYDGQFKTIFISNNLILADTGAFLGSHIINMVIFIFGSIKSNTISGDLGITDSTIVHLATGPLFEFTDYDFLRIRDTGVVKTEGGDVFDITTTQSGFFGGLIFIEDILFTGLVSDPIDSIGVIRKGFITFDSFAFRLFNNGVTLIDFSRIEMLRGTVISDRNEPASVFFTFQGAGGVLTIDALTIEVLSNETVFDIDSALSFFGITIGHSSIDLSASGVDSSNVFKLGSLNSTDLNIKCTGNVNIPDSVVIGSMYWKRNGTETIISLKGSDGDITSFSDAGGGNVVVTSTSHGISNGEVVDISECINYNGRFIASNVTSNTFEIIATFVSDDAIGRWQTGWVKVAGTTFEAEVERCSMTSDNQLTFTNPEIKKGNLRISLTCLRGSGPGAPTMEYCFFKNSVQSLTKNSDVIISAVDTNSSIPAQLALDTPVSIISGDVIELHGRNILNTANLLIVQGTIVID